MADQPGIVRFGVFEVHLGAGELRKNGARVKLQEQPFQVLAALLKQPGEIVTREELKERLWAGDTFVDFDHSLSTAVNKIREALGDSASNPRFIQTVPRRGYRFVGGIGLGPEAVELFVDHSTGQHPRRRRVWLAVAAIAALLSLSGIGYWVFTTTRTSTGAGGLFSSGESAGPGWNISRLTSDSGLSYQPTVSADGSLIAYTSDRAADGNLEIWVQRRGGDGLLRLTDHPADDHEPALSPDGKTVAFRSERGEGGIYIVPATGGNAQLIFPGGRLPRFSPHGEWIAAATDVDFYPLQGKVYVLSPDGRRLRRVAADFSHASHPVWSADGNSLLVSGIRTGETASLPGDQTSQDWYVVRLDGSHVVETGAIEILTALATIPTHSNQFVPTAWDTDGWVYFSVTQSDSENIWKLRISPGTLRAEGQPLRLTLGAGVDQGPQLLAPAGMVFSSIARNVNLWSLPMETNQGRVLGEPTRLTRHPGNEFEPSITPDGTRLTYLLQNGSELSVQLHEIDSGEQRTVARSATGDIYREILSKGGSRIAFAELVADETRFRVVPTAGGAVETLCPGVRLRRTPWNWSANERFISYASGGDPITISVVDTETCDSREILSYLNHDFFQAYFSPDDRWLAFMSWDGREVTIWIAPFDGLATIDQSRWIRVFGPSLADKPRWAPDGNAVFFTGEDQGDLVLYRQRLTPSKQPVDEAEILYRFPSGRYSVRDMHLSGREIDVAVDRIVFPMAELTGNVWLMEP